MDGVNFLGLVKGLDRYIFFFDHAGAQETIRTFARFAANPDLSFTWHDAAVLSRQVVVLTDEDLVLPEAQDNTWIE